MNRHLTINEIKLLQYLLNQSTIDYQLSSPLTELYVKELEDGGMGSLEFIDEGLSNRVFGRAILEAITLDIDNRKVMLELSVDNYGFLYQLDSFTEGFMPLIEGLGSTDKIIELNSPPLVIL